jgi:hypothetical protein
VPDDQGRDTGGNDGAHSRQKPSAIRLGRACAFLMGAAMGLTLSEAQPVSASTPCSSETDCAQCDGRLDCQWCAQTDRCISTTDRSCDQHLAASASECTACRTYKDCATCAEQEHCTWCGRGNRCVDENDSTCPAGALASTGNDCPVPDCSLLRSCSSCLNDRHCGWCGTGTSGSCVYTGETTSCPGPHVDFQDQCSDANAGSPAVPQNTYLGNGILYCIPGSPDQAIYCQCPSGSTWVGRTSLGYGNLPYGHCQCDFGKTWDPASQVCAPKITCPAGMKPSGTPNAPQCDCISGVWIRARQSCLPDPCSKGTHWDSQQQACACPLGQTLSPLSGTCLLGSCPAGMALNPNTKQCECSGSTPKWNSQLRTCESCPSAQHWTGSACACPPTQVVTGNSCGCASGGRLFGAECRFCPNGRWQGSQCVCFGGASWDGARCSCPVDTAWNGSICVHQCPGGQQWDGNDCTCPASTSWNGQACISRCTGGSQWNGSQCICPSAMVWNGSQCVTQTFTQSGPRSNRTNISCDWSGYDLNTVAVMQCSSTRADRAAPGGQGTGDCQWPDSTGKDHGPSNFFLNCYRNSSANSDADAVYSCCGQMNGGCYRNPQQYEANPGGFCN